MSAISPEETVRSVLQISHARLRKQHEIVVEFGVRSLRMDDMDKLSAQACEAAALGMGTKFAKLLRPVPDQEDLLLAYGVGWDASDIGSALIGADDASPAGYALKTHRPVITNHLGDELRFRTPSLLKKYGIKRAINVPVRGLSLPYGVLEVDSPDGNDFIESDLVFLEGLANVISMAVERVGASLDEKGPNPYSESVLNASPDCVKILSIDGNVEFFNESGLCRMEIATLDQIAGTPWVNLWPEDSKSMIENAIHRVGNGEAVRFESFCPTAKGAPRWWDVTAAPIYDKAGQIENIIAVSRDVTERHQHEEKLASLIDAQNTKLSLSHLHLEEIHHRVKNSLQLVNTLLLLQANVAVEEDVKLQLQTAASRVLTIANVHERLYQNADSNSLSVVDYLSALLTDISNAFGDRAITFEADAFPLTEERMAPLGLVVSELVTNALKYGKGAICVGLKHEDEQVTIIVTDEGDGFPDTYPKPNGTGLGMRLVKSYSGYGKNAVEVDRSAKTSTIKVRFKL